MPAARSSTLSAEVWMHLPVVAVARASSRYFGGKVENSLLAISGIHRPGNPASSFARTNTASIMSGVSRPVKVLCCDGW